MYFNYFLKLVLALVNCPLIPHSRLISLFVFTPDAPLTLYPALGPAVVVH